MQREKVSVDSNRGPHYRRGRHKKLYVIEDKGRDGKPSGKWFFVFTCPACKESHSFELPRWSFDGNFDRPTFSPSLVTQKKAAKKVCHLYLQEGQITYLSDSTHGQGGKVFSLPDMEDW